MSTEEGEKQEKLSPTPAELRFGGGWKLIIPFALFPLLIVSASVGIFFFFGKLAENTITADHYLSGLRSRSSHERWQSAYELSRFLARKDVGDDQAAFEAEILDLLQSTDRSGRNRDEKVSFGCLGPNRRPQKPAHLDSPFPERPRE